MEFSKIEFLGGLLDLHHLDNPLELLTHLGLLLVDQFAVRVDIREHHTLAGVRVVWNGDAEDTPLLQAGEPLPETLLTIDVDIAHRGFRNFASTDYEVAGQVAAFGAALHS